MLAVRQLRWGGHVARMENNRAPKMLLTAFVQYKRPNERPEQTFGHSLKKFLCLRTKMMDEDALNQTYDFQPDPDVDDLVPITGIELRDALLRTTKSVKKGTLTWIDITHDHDIWRMVVLNNYTIETVISEDAYGVIHAKFTKTPSTNT